MKTIVSVVLLIAALLGCSRKDSSEKSLQLTLAPGDIAAPIEITTNASGANSVYDLKITLITAREGALIAFAKKHPDQDVRLMLNGRVLTDLRLPAASSNEISALAISATFDSPVEAHAMAASLNQLIR